MQSFNTMYQKAVDAATNNHMETLFQDAKSEPEAHHLDCLLDPKKYPPVVRLGKCRCDDNAKQACECVCFYDAISHDQDGNIVISDKDCVGCGDCIDKCPEVNLTDIKEVVPIFDIINNTDSPVYALIAPAYISQFSPDMTPGKLRNAFKKLGFAGMIEVALFADILTLKEALEFDAAIVREDDFMLTSCCCPMWVAMIRKIYSQLIPHMPPSVSPMVACGRAIKTLHPKAKTVFIGPCIAKKAEARQEDIVDAVDFVLTFQETDDIFRAANIHPEKLEDDLRDHSSAAGRIYARTGGVSQAVQDTLKRLKPNRGVPLKPKKADGVAACKQLLSDIKSGAIDANFLEGMGCVGGCVGGPRALIGKEAGQKNVDEYAKQAGSKTPVDNQYVLELLRRLGFDTIESLMRGDSMFTRDFGKHSD